MPVGEVTQHLTFGDQLKAHVHAGCIGKGTIVLSGDAVFEREELLILAWRCRTRPTEFFEE